MRRTTAVLLALGALAIPASPALAQGEGPGNGGGQSGQCTGATQDRPGTPASRQQVETLAAHAIPRAPCAAQLRGAADYP